MTMNKKVLVIMGSPHKGNTYEACEDLRMVISHDIQVDFDYLWLKDMNILPCRGCLTCFSHGEEMCPIHDDISHIVAEIQKSDGVIFASPVYAMNVTGQMKTFIDRLSYNFHRPQFFGKKALLLTTTGFIGHKDVLKYLNSVAWIWGFEVAGKIGLITPIPTPVYRRKQNQKVIKRAAKEFCAALKRESLKNPGIMDIFMFHGQRAAFSQLEMISPADYRYWKGKGWFSKDAKYFTNAPVNPVYHLIGCFIEWHLKKQIKKDVELSEEQV